ncbi:MAG: hypothetical protein ACKO96_05380, partial [Flammeovirgaceae bacterium]
YPSNLVLGGTGVYAASRGSYNYLQVSGGTYIRPTAPTAKGIYVKLVLHHMVLKLLHRTIQLLIFQTHGINYKGRIQYNNTDNTLSFITNSSTSASMV